MMSTKSSIAWGKTFHFYHEALDHHNVYLELEGTDFEAHYNRVMVRIPIHIWEVVRQRGGANLSLADASDEDLLRMVTEHVEERLKDLAEADEAMRPLMRMSGSLQYGDALDPLEEQIARGMDYYRKERRDQQEIREAIEELERGMSR